MSAVATVTFALAVLAAAPPLQALREAQAALKPHIERDFWTDEAAGSSALLEAQWRATRAWTADWLDRHPDADLASLAAAAKADAGLDLSAVRLDAGSVLVAANGESFGTVFVLRRAGQGGFATAMALDEPGTFAGGDGDGDGEVLAAWRPDRASGDCRDGRAPATWGACGPLTGAIRRLPDEAGGARRFAVVGLYAQAAGATQGFQVSVWRWDGAAARLLLTQSLIQTADEPVIAAVRRDALILHEKGSYDHLFACGACAGRQIETTIALPAHGARVVATRSLTPELDWASALMDAITEGRPTGDLAATRVAAALTPLVRTAALDAKRHGDASWFGFITGQKVERHDGVETLCLGIDGFDVAEIFTLAPRGGALRGTAITTAPGGAWACGKGS
jgi:hypothetical protein